MHSENTLQSNQWSLIKISGDNAENFLQGQLTCDVSSLSEQKATLAALCNHQGRVLAIPLLFKQQNYFLAFINEEIKQDFIKHLNKFAVFSKVLIQDQTNDFFLSGVIGHEKDLRQVFTELPHEPYLVYKEADVSVCLLPGNERRYLLFGNLERNSDLQQLPNHLYNLDWKEITIKSGIPTIYQETAGSFTPHMLNLPQLDAVSLKKGCYVGQEIIARTHYLGKNKRHCYHGVIASKVAIVPGDVLSANDQEAGTIVDCLIKGQQTHFLAVIQDSSLNQDLLCKGYIVAVS